MLKKGAPKAGSSGYPLSIWKAPRTSSLDFRNFVNRDMRQLSAKRFAEILEENGYDPDADPSLDEIIDLVKDDHQVMMSVRGWVSNQQLTWKQVQDYFHANADKYFDEMESADNIGPGSLELNPGIEPEYTKHEIHIQPGGYTGDPFAGYINYYGVNNFYGGQQLQRRSAGGHCCSRADSAGR